MALDLSVITPLLRQLWSDTMDIEGCYGSENPDGSTEPANMTPKASGIQCKLSLKNLDSPYNRDFDRTVTKVIPRISCGVEAPVAKGDFITVFRRNHVGTVLQVYKGSAGLPAVFQSHQEFEIMQEGQA